MTLCWLQSGTRRACHVRRGLPVGPKLKSLQQGKSHNPKVDRRLPGLPAAVVGRDFFDAVLQVMGPDNEFGQHKEGLGTQAYAVEEFFGPGLGPIIVIDPQLKEIIEGKNINDRKKKAEELIGIALPPDA